LRSTVAEFGKNSESTDLIATKNTKKHKEVEKIADPQSKVPSISFLCLFVLFVAIFFPAIHAMSNLDTQPVALITGGAIRVGRAIVLELARRNYRVAIHANTSLDRALELATEINKSGRTATAFGADLRDEDAARAMIDRVRRHFGRLDALVNSAAMWSPTPIAEVMADDVRRFFEVNTLSTFVCCHHAGLIMMEQAGGGAIVNIGDWAIQRPYRDYGAYFISKAAIPALTRMFAVELAPKVRVNAVLPGPVLLPESVSEEERRRAIAGTLLARPGRPENVALAVAALIENDFITGACLPVDGGRTIGNTS
jgi:pteridine reductase